MELLLLSSVDDTKSQKSSSCGGISALTHERIFERPVSSTSNTTSKRSYPAGNNLNQKLHQKKSKAILIEIFYKLKTNKGYGQHPCSFFRILRKLGVFKVPKTKQKAYVPKSYHTPTELGVKWQDDLIK